MQKTTKKMDDIKEESDELLKRKHRASSNLEHYHSSRSKYDEKYKYSADNYSLHRGELDELIKKCLETWDRVSVTKTVQEIERLVVEVKALLELKEQQ